MVGAIPRLHTITLPGHAQEEVPVHLPHLPADHASPVLEVSASPSTSAAGPSCTASVFPHPAVRFWPWSAATVSARTTLLRALAGLQKHEGAVAVRWPAA